MASVTNQKVRVVKTITLDLDQDEAQALLELTGACIANFSAENDLEKAAARVYDALDNADFVSVANVKLDTAEQALRIILDDQK
jgi:polyribonucleotide nucleotidyltransferase